MQEQDLKQIKQVVRDVVREEVGKRVEESESLITLAIAQGFNDVQVQFDNVYSQLSNMQKKLDKKANESTVLNWGDSQVIPIKNDVNKLKFLHKDEWKELPDSGTISRKLIEQGI